MSVATICPNDMIAANAVVPGNVDEIESNIIVPIIAFDDKCTSLGIDLVFSTFILVEISKSAPWELSQDPQIRSYLSTWIEAVLTPLMARGIGTDESKLKSICTNIKSKTIAGHFHDLIQKLQKSSGPRKAKKYTIGIHKSSTCPVGTICKSCCNIHSKCGLLILLYPWYSIYPHTLPSHGDYPFVPPKTWTSGTTPIKCPNNGFIDKSGNSWQHDTLHKDHWDVQLRKTGKHINVSYLGCILS